MDYIAAHSIEVGKPALRDKETGEDKRESTLQTLNAGDKLPSDIDKAEIERLVELGAVVKGNTPEAKAAAAQTQANDEKAAEAAKAQAKADADKTKSQR